MSKTTHTILVQSFHHDKITIYKLASGKKPIEKRSYYFRYLDPQGKGYIRKSAKTSDEAEAKRVAFNAYEQSQIKKTLGIEENASGIHSLISKFDRHLSQNKATKQKRHYLLYKFIVPFFSKYGELTHINDDDIWDYLRWRNDNYKPSNNGRSDSISLSTIQIEFSYLKFLLKRGFESRLILQVPSFPTIQDIERKGGFQNFTFKEIRERRGFWSDYQNKVISQWLSDFRSRWKNTILKDKGEYDGGHCLNYTRRVSRFNWVRIYLLIRIVRCSGLRPYFLKRMMFKNVELFTDRNGKSFTLIQVLRHQSKVGKRREVVTDDLDRLFKIFQDYKYEYERYFGVEPSDNDLVFGKTTARNEEAIISRLVTKYLRKLDDVLETPVSYSRSDDGAKMLISLYSMRKTFISKQLENERLSPYLVAKNAGTSEAELARSYDLNLSRVFRELYTSAVQAKIEEDIKAGRKSEFS